jgi:hypothetical protein|nr:MAG TPA: hypothetical protein [Caudoviricetes sp.]
MSQIAVVRLAPGQAGYYDELSGVYLTAGKRTAAIPSGTNCAQLRRSVRMGTIILQSGTLGGDIPEVRIMEHEGKYYLVPNTEEVNKPVYANTIPVADESEATPDEVSGPTDEELLADDAENTETEEEDVRDLTCEINADQSTDAKKAIISYKVGTDVTGLYYVIGEEGEKVEVKKFTARSKKRDGVFEIPATAEMQVVNIFINELEESVQAVIVNPVTE